ncbi:MAG: hypothetical protein HKN91_00815 [Acidimicrobiia bacterium]|nr:hypothetical protein [Acidimicrobiia bacterium]
MTFTVTLGECKPEMPTQISVLRLHANDEYLGSYTTLTLDLLVLDQIEKSPFSALDVGVAWGLDQLQKIAATSRLPDAPFDTYLEFVLDDNAVSSVAKRLNDKACSLREEHSNGNLCVARDFDEQDVVHADCARCAFAAMELRCQFVSHAQIFAGKTQGGRSPVERSRCDRPGGTDVPERDMPHVCRAGAASCWSVQLATGRPRSQPLPPLSSMWVDVDTASRLAIADGSPLLENVSQEQLLALDVPVYDLDDLKSRLDDLSLVMERLVVGDDCRPASCDVRDWAKSKPLKRLGLALGNAAAAEYLRSAHALTIAVKHGHSDVGAKAARVDCDWPPAQPAQAWQSIVAIVAMALESLKKSARSQAIS